MEKLVGGKAVANWDQRKDVGNGEKNAKCTTSAVMLDGEISKYVYILLGVAQGCTSSPNLFKVKLYINDMIVAVEAAKQGVTVGEGTCLRMISWQYQKHQRHCRNK